MRYVLRRLLHGLITVWLSVTIVFLLSTTLGDPVLQILPLDHTREEYLRMSHLLGYDRPIIVQYLSFLGKLATGDLGDSTSYQAPVRQLIGESFPVTFTLALGAIVLAMVIAVPVGMYAGARPGGIADRLGTGISTLALALPTFVLGVVLIIVFGVRLGWLPVAGLASPSGYILPIVSLTVWAIGTILRLAQSSAREVSLQPYILVARSKGMSEWHIRLRHILPSTLAPVITYAGLEFGMLLSGAVITEALFDLPGIGSLALQGVMTRDRSLILGCVLTIAISFVVVNLVTDLICAAVDPRIRAGR